MAAFDVLFNVAAFLAGLSLLERGAKLFVSGATTLAKRLHLPEMLVAILIAGAEWEEMAVVALSLAQKRPGLAVGNIVGSSVANILGAFALGLVFSGGPSSSWEGFDRGAKLACAGLLALTTAVSLFSLADILWYRLVAAMLLAAFAAYVVAVLWTIWTAMFYTEAHQDDDDDDDEDDIESGAAAHEHLDDASSASSALSSEEAAGESTSLIPKPSASGIRRFHHVLMPSLKLLCGFVALAVSGFLLSHTSTHLAVSFDMSDTAFGATILSLATTLPEKFIAVASSTRGHAGLLVADAVGSNVFLLTLCLGITTWSVAAHGWHDFPVGDDERTGYVDISRIEAWWLWSAAVALMVVVGVGGKGIGRFAGVRQVVGVLMLVAYGGFLAVELTILRF